MTKPALFGVSGSARLKPHESRLLTLGFSLLLAMVAVTAASAIFGIGGSAIANAIQTWVSAAIYILVAAIVALRALRATASRRSWTAFAVGLSLYGLGNLLWSLWIGNGPHPASPSICDPLWLSLYPLSYLGIIGVARVRGYRQLPAGVWLDGIIAGTGLAALGAAVFLDPVLASATGRLHAVATQLAYPICDLLLAALVVGVLALRGWRIDRTMGLLGCGFLLLAVADCLHAVEATKGSLNPTSLTNLFYFLGVTLLAFAAWQREAAIRESRLASWSVMLVPAGFMLVALGLLLASYFRELNPFAYGFAAATLLTAAIRIGFVFRELRHLAAARSEAVTDDLTSLPNRRLLLRALDDSITAAQLTGGGLVVMILDLDSFKQLNDTLGHSAGDDLLRQIGPRLQRILRATDTVARLGGDEFGLLFAPQPDEEAIARIAEKVLKTLDEPFEVQGLALRVTASIGIASFPAHARDAEGLLKHADIAMYQAKSTHSGYAFYARERDTNVRGSLLLASEVVAALEQDRIVIHFQPKASGASRRIVGAEALVRLKLPDGRVVPPAEFLPAAEQGGLSRALTRRVLGLALDQLARWREHGHALHVAVNTTVADLLDVRFPGEVAAALAARGLPRDALMLEVTETSILSDPVRIGGVLISLAELGVGLSLDDFGTGYSSLTHLKSLPVRELKVDRSFVSNMCTNDTDAAIVYAMIELAHKLGIRVVAEGVADERTWEALDALGCELIQGYFLSRAVTAAELDTQLEDMADEAAPDSSDAEMLVPALPSAL